MNKKISIAKTQKCLLAAESRHTFKALFLLFRRNENENKQVSYSLETLLYHALIVFQIFLAI